MSILLDWGVENVGSFICPPPGGVHSDPRYTALLKKMNLDE
jgi:hypothetical protein